MGQIDDMEAKLDWLVKAVQYLLSEQAGVEVEDVGWEYEAPPEAEIGEEWFAPIHEPKAPAVPVCPHRNQGISQGRLRCIDCGFIYGDTGVVQNQVGPSGNIIPDRNPPQWSTQRSPGASSKNPGIPLVPHSD